MSEKLRLGLILTREGLHERTANPLPHVVIDDFLHLERSTRTRKIWRLTARGM